MKKNMARKDAAKNLRKFTSELVAKRYSKPKMKANEFAQEGAPMQEMPVISPITGEGPEAMENLSTWEDPTVRDVAGGLEKTLRAAYAQESEAQRIANEYGGQAAGMLSQGLNNNEALKSMHKGAEMNPGTADLHITDAKTGQNSALPWEEEDFAEKRKRYAKARMGR